MTDLNKPPRLWVSKTGLTMVDLDRVCLILPAGDEDDPDESRIFLQGDGAPFVMGAEATRDLMKAWWAYRVGHQPERL